VRLKATSENLELLQGHSAVAVILPISLLSQVALLPLKKELTELKFSIRQENLLSMFVRETHSPFRYPWMWLLLTGKLFMQQILLTLNYMYLIENENNHGFHGGTRILYSVQIRVFRG